MYQIYNEEGYSILLSGVGSQIDMTSLPSGKYWVNYDNKTELVKKISRCDNLDMHKQ